MCKYLAPFQVSELPIMPKAVIVILLQPSILIDTFVWNTVDLVLLTGSIYLIAV